MRSISSLLKRLEGIERARGGVDPPRAIPPAWVRYGRRGVMEGPGLNDQPAESQLRTFAVLAAIDNSTNIQEPHSGASHDGDRHEPAGAEAREGDACGRDGRSTL